MFKNTKILYLKIGLTVLLIAGIMSGNVVAGVNLKNGNFYISYNDLTMSSLAETDITRTYNSKSVDIGWFGFGWGSDFETRLETSASGSIIIQENGSGATTYFEPVEKDTVVYSENLKNSVKKLVKEFIKANPDKSKNEDDLAKKILNDKEYRHLLWRRARQKGSIDPISIPKDTEFISSQRGIQRVTRTNVGYSRNYVNGKEEIYDHDGRMIEIRLNDGNWIKLSYYNNQSIAARSKVKKITNSQGDKIFFFFGDQDTVERIVSNKQMTVRLHYDAKKNLISSKDDGDKLYQYRYDIKHNLTEILSADGSKMEITYKADDGFVKSVKKSDGSITKYTYVGEKSNPDYHYWTLVTKENYLEKPVTDRYEYKIGVLPDGLTYTKKSITEISGFRSETTYNKDGNPLDIKRGNSHTEFTYNDRALLERKKTETEITELEYHPEFNKIIWVRKKLKYSADQATWNKYKYDKYENLIYGESSDGNIVTLTYEDKQIYTIETNGKILVFKYNKKGKPIEIAIRDGGKINITYGDGGEILDVSSDQGQEMTFKVTRAFQRLLDIVEPAGVSLNF